MKNASKAIVSIVLALILSVSLFSCVVIPDEPSDKTTDPVDNTPPTDTDGKSEDNTSSTDTDVESEKAEEYVPPESYDFIIRNSNRFNVESDQYAALRCGSEMAFGIAVSYGYRLDKYANGTLVREEIEAVPIDTSREDPLVPHVMYSLERDTVSYALKGYNFKSDVYIPIGGDINNPISASALVPGQTYYRIMEVMSVEPWGPEAVKKEWFVGQHFFYFLVTIV